MITEDRITMGIVGTILSATGASISVTEIQAIISIIITVLGFILGVLIPSIIKIVTKVKEAKKDGKITKEELEDITNDIKELGDKINKENKQ